MDLSLGLSFDLVRGLYEHGSRHVSELLQQVQQKDWAAPTPNPGWDVRELLTHLTSEALWLPPLLAGATVEDVGAAFDGDVLGKEPVRAWTSATAAAVAAVDAPDEDVARRTVHLSYGDVPAGYYVFEAAQDLFLHAWDLARAIGADDEVPREALEVLWRVNKDRPDQIAGSGVFGMPVHVPEDSDLQTKLLGLFGRAQGPRREP